MNNKISWAILIMIIPLSILVFPIMWYVLSYNWLSIAGSSVPILDLFVVGLLIVGIFLFPIAIPLLIAEYVERRESKKKNTG